MNILGIDIGGSSVKGARFEGNKVVKRFALKKVDHPSLRKNVYARICIVIEELGLENIEAVGLASTGDVYNGVVTKSNNLPDIEGIPLVAQLTEKYGIPFFLCNDAVAATLSESSFYPAVHDIFLMTFGTGIGCAHKIGGLVTHTEKEDYGHRILDPNGPLCQCGQHGCAKAFLSAKVIGQQTMDVYGRSLAPKMLMSKYLEGDENAQKILSDYGKYLNQLLDLVLSEINPDLLILGGGLMEAESVMKEIIKVPPERYRFAKLGNSAGFIGAKIYAELKMRAR